LVTSEDIDVQSALVGMMSAKDVARAMELGAVSGQLAVAADFVAAREMPVLAAFLEDKGNLLRTFAVDSIMRATATRALAWAMEATGAKVGDWGANEVAEGLVRMSAAEAVAQRSAELAVEGEVNAAVGVEEIAEAQQARKVARKLEKKGIKQVAEGTEAVGQGEVIGAVAEAFDEAAQ
jgi:hypothetical protein